MQMFSLQGNFRLKWEASSLSSKLQKARRKGSGEVGFGGRLSDNERPWRDF